MFQDSEDRREIASRLAEAHEKRLNPSEHLTYAQKKIREQARRELEEEEARNRAEQSDNSGRDVDYRKDERDKEVLFEHTEQISSVRYTCDLFDEDLVLPKKEVGLPSLFAMSVCR